MKIDTRVGPIFASIIIGTAIWSYVNIILQSVQIITIPLEYRFLATNFIILNNPPAAIQVEVKGISPFNNKYIGKIKAFLDLSEASRGEKDYPIYFSPDLEQIDDLQVVTQEQSVSLDIDSKLLKAVKISPNVRLANTLVNNYEIEDIDLDPQTSVIEGPSRFIQNISQLKTASFTITSPENTSSIVNVIVPTKVNIISNATTSLKITLKEKESPVKIEKIEEENKNVSSLEEEENKDKENIATQRISAPIIAINQNSNITFSPSELEVTIPANIDSTNITGFIDLQNIKTKGLYTVPLVLFNDKKPLIDIESIPKTMEIKVKSYSDFFSESTTQAIDQKEAETILEVRNLKDNLTMLPINIIFSYKDISDDELKNIHIYVDAQKITSPGTYSLPVISSNENIKVPKDINLLFEEK